MDDFVKRVYVGEIKAQCQFALSAVGALNNALQMLASESAAARGFHGEVFRQIHSFLTHASNVSRIFWPVAPVQGRDERDDKYQARIGRLDRVQRGITLRQLYGIDERNCLKRRTLRDHLEHYDERLDHWRTTSARRNIASDTIGPRNAIVGIDSTDMMRWFDPSTNSFLFRGEEYDLQELATAVDELFPQSVRLEEELWNRPMAATRAGRHGA